MRRRGMFGRIATRAVLAFLSCVATARAVPVSETDRFVARHRCDVLERLRRIHERGPRTTSRDRFLAITVQARPEHYVQCMFGDNDTRMLCEASSGAYAAIPDLLTPGAIAILRGLGFTLTDPAGNFRREIDLGTPPALERAAVLMLEVLSTVYAASPEDGLRFTAPKAGDAGAACRPVSWHPGPDRRVT